MNKTILTMAGGIMLAGSSMAQVTIKVNPDLGLQELDVTYQLIDNLVKPRMERPEAVMLTADLNNGQYVLPVVEEGNVRYVINAEGETFAIYATPGDEMVVTLNSIEPVNYSVTGSKLMEDISMIDNKASQLNAQYQKMVESGTATEGDIEALNAGYEKFLTDFISNNPNAAAVPYAMLEIEGQPFLDIYATLTPEAKGSPLAALMEYQKTIVERNIAAEKRKAELQSGNVEAPDFTFNNVEGQPVSLSDFKGKWVVIDFWGTWCPWCIKGFPALKEAYAELQPKLEVLGVACNDKYDAWKNGLKKYDLPWVNVYNPVNGGGKILEDYAVEGFPTKVIVNPEGKIANITTGEDPSFFNILRELVK